MIPKIIHYCWFGGNPLPELAIRCIESWKKYLPDYEIKEWNESNFNVDIIPYTAEAYKAKKYAFVSDYARFWVLYNFGGLYFDTDVLVLKNMDHIINRGGFMGFEQPSEEMKNNKVDYRVEVAPGLGIGISKNNPLFKELLDYYANQRFLKDDGSFNYVTIVTHTTNVLEQKGLIPNNQLQEISGVWIYPWDYFCPQSFFTKKNNITPNSVTIHLYSQSWQGKGTILKQKIIRLLGPVLTNLIVSVKHRFNRQINEG